MARGKHVSITELHRAAFRMMGWIGPDDDAAKEAEAKAKALELISYGAARFERSGALIEFCFNGLRYIVPPSLQLEPIMHMIGEAAIKQALAKCYGGEF